MEANSRVAANAYKMLAELKDGLDQKSVGKVVDTGEKSDFPGMVGDVVSKFTEQAKGVDSVTQAMASGKADLVDVVTAVSQAQLQMETLVSVRDQVISAYEKIMQMPI
jgi:flagellar hook-basal body complex protein FliE